jgi:hypothetical protein
MKIYFENFFICNVRSNKPKVLFLNFLNFHTISTVSDFLSLIVFKKIITGLRFPYFFIKLASRVLCTKCSLNISENLNVKSVQLILAFFGLPLSYSTLVQSKSTMIMVLVNESRIAKYFAYSSCKQKV